MDKNKLAFIIPLFILVVVASGILDNVGFIKQYKSRINLEQHKLVKMFLDEEHTTNLLRNNYNIEKNRYREEISKEIKDKELVDYAVKYLYYLSERNVCAAGFNNNQEKAIECVFKENKNMQDEYQKILDKGYTPKINLIELYKRQSEMNKLLSKFSYGMILRYD